MTASYFKRIIILQSDPNSELYRMIVTYVNEEVD